MVHIDSLNKYRSTFRFFSESRSGSLDKTARDFSYQKLIFNGPGLPGFEYCAKKSIILILEIVIMHFLFASFRLKNLPP